MNEQYTTIAAVAMVSTEYIYMVSALFG